ncbi:hypothetical protein Tsubulata_015655 [Turnera subulata]|uniref:MalT-like TPR region domain-containing protein n=1 Tax=Turnera subulata TaxID=218843 RepID=A0A9Q0FUH9_9ROSI|nr:hypothetical protein Tsubulata_015655 [Turnera subulata]
MQMRQLAAKLLRRIPHLPQKNLSSSTRAITANGLPYSIPGQATFSQEYGSSRWKTNGWNLHPWTLMAGQAAIIFGMNANHVLADPGVQNSSGNDLEGDGLVGLRKIEDGSIVSNEHTLKWRIFTDNGREYFLKASLFCCGKMDQAEKFFVSAVSEAKEGFGETDPHVASACNNLAELYRVKKEFDKAEPLYLEAINILEKSFGPEDIRVGTAVHNLGQFYLMRRKLEEARKCYERALKVRASAKVQPF